MVIVLYLILRRFHHFTGLKRTLQIRLLLSQFTSYNTITAQGIYIKIDQRFTELKVTEYSKHCKRQFQAVVIQCTAGETKFVKCEK